MSGDAFLEIDTAELARGVEVFRRFPQRMIRALVRANKESSSIVLGVLKDNLANKILNRLSGTLIRSWAMKPTVVTESAVEGGVGSKLSYAAYHEYGFRGEVTVKLHQRTVVYGRTTAPFNVGPYTYNRNYAGRPYARPALKASRRAIEQEHMHAIAAAASKETG